MILYLIKYRWEITQLQNFFDFFLTDFQKTPPVFFPYHPPVQIRICSVQMVKKIWGVISLSELYIYTQEIDRPTFCCTPGVGVVSKFAKRSEEREKKNIFCRQHHSPSPQFRSKALASRLVYITRRIRLPLRSSAPAGWLPV